MKKLTKKQAGEIREMCKQASTVALCYKYGVNRNTIWRIKTGLAHDDAPRRYIAFRDTPENVASGDIATDESKSNVASGHIEENVEPTKKHEYDENDPWKLGK